MGERMQIKLRGILCVHICKFILKVKSGVRLSVRWSNREVSSGIMTEHFWSVITSRGLEKKSLWVWKYGNCTVKQKPDRLCPHCSECQSVPFLETSFLPWCHIIEACGQPNAPLVTISALLVGTIKTLWSTEVPLHITLYITVAKFGIFVFKAQCVTLFSYQIV